MSSIILFYPPYSVSSSAQQSAELYYFNDVFGRIHRLETLLYVCMRIVDAEPCVFSIHRCYSLADDGICRSNGQMLIIIIMLLIILLRRIV